MFRIRRKWYKGTSPLGQKREREYNEAVEKIEIYLIERMNLDSDPSRVFTYMSLSFDLEIDVELVRRILVTAGGGDNGITLRKANFPKV